ncbi:MAG: lytic transglycosylase domain-containing protein [Sphingomicrobium sp.]
MSRFSRLMVVMLVGAVAASAQAQVIEIGDDGQATTYSRPTRFMGDDLVSAVGTGVTARLADVDRYEQAAKAEGIDVHLLRAVAWTESRGRQNAVSPKGALGVMQLMPGTAAELGVDPLDPNANLHGGARYLARQLTRFQSVPLALAAYNAGPGAVLRWGGIPPYAETQAYVTQIMARYQRLPVPLQPIRLVAAPAPRRIDLMLIEVPSL